MSSYWISRVGFPEVLIGLLPGAAGTQRLPRVSELGVAMDMISSGAHVTAPKAFEYGIIDKVKCFYIWYYWHYFVSLLLTRC